MKMYRIEGLIEGMSIQVRGKECQSIDNSYQDIEDRYKCNVEYSSSNRLMIV